MQPITVTTTTTTIAWPTAKVRVNVLAAVNALPNGSF